MLAEKFYISIYEPEYDRTSFLEDLKPNANREVEANFISSIWAAREFDCLADAQCFCKVLVSKYVKHFTYCKTQMIDDNDRDKLEVQLLQRSDSIKSTLFPIWGVSLLNNNEVIVA